MNEYTVKKVKGKWGVCLPNGLCFVAFIAESKARHIARMHNEGINPLTQRIAELEAALKEVDKTLSTNVNQYGVSIYDAVDDALELIENALSKSALGEK